MHTKSLWITEGKILRGTPKLSFDQSTVVGVRGYPVTRFPMSSKPCSDCGATKPLSEFATAATCRDGHRSYCKTCHKRRKDRWRAANAKHHSEKGIAWRAANPEKAKAVQAAADIKRKLSGATRAAAKRRREADPDRHRAYLAHRRAKLQKATPVWADKKAISEIYKEAKRRGLTVDHVIPVMGKLVSGLHVANNLQLIPLTENIRKHNKYEP